MSPLSAKNYHASLIPLHHLGIVAVQGDDAKKFLHAQLSHDFLQCPPDRARLAAYCSAQGRMLASFVALQRNSSEWLLIGSRDVLEGAIRRLRMFVLRDKVVLRDATNEFMLHGLIRSISDINGESTKETATPWQIVRNTDSKIQIIWPAVSGMQSILQINSADTMLPASKDSNLFEAWREQEIRAGFLLVHAGIADQLIPQMLNYESLDGISFGKGCYPGQEVVARAQFRGSVKRKTWILKSQLPLKIDQDLYAKTEPETECGFILVDSAISSIDHSYVTLACIAGAHAKAEIILKNQPQSKIEVCAVPYSLKVDI